MTRPIAYSYARFSTSEQERGDSERRQIEDTRKYAEEHGYTLDESIGVDRGKSAFTGKNISDRALGEFIRRVEAGKIPKGSVLLVESPDRVSRQAFSECWPYYQRILSGDIAIHFLSIRRVLKPNHSFVDVLQIGVDIDRSNLESAMKSERLSKKWAQKKHHSPAGVAITQHLPGWLRGRSGEPIIVDERKAEVVRRIFEMAASGCGRRLITRRLNQAKVPTFCGAPLWGHSYVHKILTNRAVLGEYQPYKGRPGNRKPEGEPRLDFYPAVVSAELWNRAHKSIAERSKGKSAGQVGPLISNLFAGLVFDANMGLPMHYTDKGVRDRPKLRTASKDINGATPNFVVYADFESAFLTWFDALDWTTIIDISDATDIKKAEEEIATFDLSILRTEGRIQTTLDLLVDTPSPALKTRLLKLEETLAADKAARESAAKRLSDAKSIHRDFTEREIAFAALSRSGDLETRARLRQEIRHKVSRIDIRFGEPVLTAGWKGEGNILSKETVAKLSFVNGAVRWIYLDGETARLYVQHTS